MYLLFKIVLLKAFDSEITRLVFLPDQDMLMTASKAKSIKLWAPPREWRDQRKVNIEKDEAAKNIKEIYKTKLIEQQKKADEDSDEDDLVGWHLD